MPNLQISSSGPLHNAQQARSVLSDYGFTPLLAKHGDTEHWVRGPRHCVLRYQGEPEEAENAREFSLEHAYVAGCVHGQVILSFD